MNEDAARTVLLVRAIEESDTAGEVLPLADRRWATREAASSDPAAGRDAALTPGESAFLVKRARPLLPIAARRAPALTAAHDAAGWRRGLSLAAAIGAFVLGLALNEAPAARQINILAFPLLGMLAWNIAVYVLLLAAAMRGRSTGRGARREPLVRSVLAVMARASAPFRRGEAHSPEAAAIRSFVAQWNALVAPLYAARAKRLLHTCAALVALGAVAGLYLRGIAFEYRAGWESTFLDAGAVHALLKIALGPASALTGIPIPAEAHIAALRWNGAGAGENAAPWMHLYAATAIVFVVLPRLALALWAGLRESRLRAALRMEDIGRYCRGLLAARHEHERTATALVLPYNCTLTDRARKALETALAQKMRARVALRLLPAVRYGEEDAVARSLPHGEPADLRVLVCNMSAIPEAENHGLALHAWRAAASGSDVVVALDEGPYRRRLAGQAGAEARIAERREAWHRFVRAHGADMLAADLAGEPAETRTSP